MKYQAHTVGAVAVVFGVNHITRKIGVEINPLFFFTGAVLGGLIPDIDHPKSMLGHAIQPVSTIIYKTIGHRTFTHSILFIVITCIFLSLFSLDLSAGMGFGILSHIILDLLTPKTNGVAFLYPFYKKKIKFLK